MSESIPLIPSRNNKVGDFHSDEKRRKKFGEPRKFDPNFKGPISNRSCTDKFCLFWFLIVAATSSMIAFYAYSNGNPLLLTYPTDSEGRICGHGKMAARPYLHFFDLLQCLKNVQSLPFQGCPTSQVCVKQCPNRTWSWFELDLFEKMNGIDVKTRQQQLLCIDEANLTASGQTPLSNLVKSGICAPYLVSERPIMKRCVPEFITQLSTGLTDLVTTKNESLQGVFDADGSPVTIDRFKSSKTVVETLVRFQSWSEAILADLQAAWKVTVVFITIAMAVSYFWIILLQWFAGILIWLAIVLFLIFCLAVDVFAVWRYNLLAGIVTTPETIEAIAGIFTPHGNVTVLSQNSLFPNETTDFWLAVIVLCSVVLLISSLALCLLGDRINLAISLFEETSIAIGQMPSVLVWPIVPFVLQIAVLVLATGTDICIITLSKPEFMGADVNTTDLSTVVTEGCNYASLVMTNLTDVATSNATIGAFCRFVKYDPSKLTTFLHVFNAFSFFWGYNFVAGFGIVVLAGCFASYYWTLDKKRDLPDMPLFGAVWRPIRYHIGSIAFGSFLLAVLQMTHLILDYLFFKLKQQKNEVAEFLLKCFQCCFRCLEVLVKFVTEQAFIGIAIHGGGFLQSAFDGWQLIMRNAARTIVLSGVTRLIIIISKMLVTAAMIVLAYFYFHGELVAAFPNYLADSWPKLNYFYIPIFAIAIGSFAVSSICFHVYHVGVDTMFVSFLEDIERNDGSDERPYYMSRNLGTILR